jgi:hypothetical protein
MQGLANETLCVPRVRHGQKCMSLDFPSPDTKLHGTITESNQPTDNGLYMLRVQCRSGSCVE